MTPPGTVLVVEDDDDLRELLAMILEKEGYRVLTAVHGGDALAVLAEAPEAPDLVLLDLLMPIMGGLEFRRRQLQDPRLAPIPVLILSGEGRPTPELTALGVRRVVQKPLHGVEPLLKMVRDALAAE